MKSVNATLLNASQPTPSATDTLDAIDRQCHDWASDAMSRCAIMVSHHWQHRHYWEEFVRLQANWIIAARNAQAQAGAL